MTPVFDHDGSLHRMGNDQQLFEEMVGFLKDDAPLRLKEIQNSLGEANWLRAQLAAHSLKGLVSNFGAARAFTAASKLETLVRQKKQLQELEAAFDELDSAVTELQNALAPYVKAGSSAAF